MTRTITNVHKIAIDARALQADNHPYFYSLTTLSILYIEKASTHVLAFGAQIWLRISDLYCSRDYF